MTYRPDLDQKFKELKFEHFNGRECDWSRKDTFHDGAAAERQLILERIWRYGEKVLTIDEIIALVKGEI